MVCFKERLVRFCIGNKCVRLWIISHNGSQSCRRAVSFGPRKVGIRCCVKFPDILWRIFRTNVFYNSAHCVCASLNAVEKFRHYDYKFFVLFRSNKGASKQRRDQINNEIGTLRDLLPLPESSRQRLSQLQIMSLSCVFIRKCNILQKRKSIFVTCFAWKINLESVP